MAAAANLLPQAEVGPEHELPLALAVADLPQEVLGRIRADQLIHAMAQMAIHDGPIQETAVGNQPAVSLMQAIYGAAEGDPMSRRLIAANVTADLVERSIKAGHIMRVPLSIDRLGRVVQHGHRLETVLANSLRYTGHELRVRTEAETRNGMRLEALLQDGWLDDYYFAVFSQYPDDMSDDTAEAAGFFADTKTCAIQLIGYQDGQLVEETAFVAGVSRPGAARHDERAIRQLAMGFGVSLEGKTAAQTIDTPLLIHRSLLPEGASSLARAYDDHVGGTFFGQATPQQDYSRYRQICRERELQLQPDIDDIVAALVGAAHELQSPVAATRRLHVLSQARLLERALGDPRINPRIFGTQAAWHITEARQALLADDMPAFERARSQAHSTARSSSCPAGFIDDMMRGMLEGDKAEERAVTEITSKFQRMNCPFCHDSKQYGDPCSKNQYCTNCTATVRNGRVVYEGNGGQKPVPKSVTRSSQQSVGVLALFA